MEKESEQSYLGWLHVVVRFAHLPAGPSLRARSRAAPALERRIPIGMKNPVS
jgi:hypothetical protein